MATVTRSRRIRRHTDLEVYQQAFDAAMELFECSKAFPSEERFSLTDQIRRSSRSVCANLAEAWRKRKYEAAFISKLSDCISEAAETEVWIQFAVKCKYLNRNRAKTIYEQYEAIIAKLVTMSHHAQNWIIR